MFIPVKLVPREAHRSYVDSAGRPRTKKAAKTVEFQKSAHDRAAIEMARLHREPLQGNVLVWITLIHRYLKSMKLTERLNIEDGELVLHGGRSDVDNHLKSIFDSVKKVCFGDDRKIVFAMAGSFLGVTEGFHLFALPITNIEYWYKAEL